MLKKITPIIAVMSILVLFSACSSGGGLPESQRLVGPSRMNMRSGNMYMNIQEFDNALERYLEVVKENPENIEALKIIGDIFFHYAEENPSKAKEYYTDAHIYYGRAIAAYIEIKELGRFPNLKDRVDDAQLRKMACWARLFNLGQRLYSEESYDIAIQSFYDLAELAPDSTKTYIMIATIHQIQDNNEKAAEYYYRIANQDDKDIISRTNLAAYYFNMGNYAEALQWYNELIRVAPDDPENHYMKGIVLMNMELLEDALQAFEAAHRVDPEFTDAVINAGMIAYSLNDTAKTIKYYRLAHELEPEVQEWLIYLLHSLNVAEQYEELMKYGMILYELDNTSIDAVSAVYIAATQLGQTEVERRFLNILQRLGQ